MKGFKIRLEFNNKQKTLAIRHAGAARFAYNWGLSRSKDAYISGQKRPSAIDLHKEWVIFKNTQAEWAKEVSKYCPQEAFRNLDKAYRRKFTVKNSGLPRFKKRGINDSFYLEGGIKVDGYKIKVPKFGWLKCSELLPNVNIKNVTISRTAHHWFISFIAPNAQVSRTSELPIVGVDLGVKHLCTLSDGNSFENIRPFKKFKRKLKIAQRKVSNKFVRANGKNQSNNYKKSQAKVSALHYRIACIRRDALHKVTNYLAKNHSEVVIEDLNVRGMTKNRKLSSAILDSGFHEFRRQLTYKCELHGTKITIVDRFYPSSKTCSCCGNIKKDLRLSQRTYNCDSCGMIMDRDLNAAINLKNKSVSYTALQAC